jgi:hypothetical protein
MKFLTFLLIALFSSNSFAYTRQFKDWKTNVENNYSESYIHNNSGSILGFFCNANGCITYFNVRTSCVDGQTTNLLIATDKNTISADATCVVLDLKGRREYVNRIDGPDIVTLFQQGSSVSIAMALEGGQIKVSRFSLAGYNEAAYFSASTTYKGQVKDYRDATY